LLERGAEVNLQSECGRTALFFAAHSGNASIAKLLLEKGAQPDIKDEWRHNTKQSHEVWEERCGAHTGRVDVSLERKGSRGREDFRQGIFDGGKLIQFLAGWCGTCTSCYVALYVWRKWS
jgi:hypothetical protein